MRKFSVDFAEKYRTESIKLTDDARMAFEKYNWPGNIRELRNVVEQLSVLSEEKTISVQDLVATVPTIFETSLPVRANTTNGSGTSFEEREILYKFLFEMKNDLNDVKSLVYELIRSNDLNMPDIGAFKNSGTTLSGHVSEMEREVARNYNNLNEVRPGSEQPIIIHKGDNSNFHNAEEVIESLSLEDMEKEYIKKALKKCKGRRKDAAEELGISERTLYRKINQYQIEE
jgi:DNA-binding NtrC family response regulator